MILDKLLYQQIQMLQPASVTREGLAALFNVQPTDIDAAFMYGCGDTLTTYKTKAVKRAKLLRQGNQRVVRIIDYLHVRPEAGDMLARAIDPCITECGNIMALYEDDTAMVFDITLGARKVNLFIDQVAVKAIAFGRVAYVPTSIALLATCQCHRVHNDVHAKLVETQRDISIIDGLHLGVARTPEEISNLIYNAFMIRFSPKSLRVTDGERGLIIIEGIKKYHGRAKLTTTKKVINN